MSKKEHRIPIRVSSVLRILEGERKESAVPEGAVDLKHKVTQPQTSEQVIESEQQHHNGEQVTIRHGSHHHKHQDIEVSPSETSVVVDAPVPTEPEEHKGRTVAINFSGGVQAAPQLPPQVQEEIPVEPTVVEVSASLEEKEESPPQEVVQVIAPIAEIVNTPQVVPEKVSEVVIDKNLCEDVDSAFVHDIVIPTKPLMVNDVNVLSLRVAYFCMEIGISTDLQFYAGGLGILAGDMLKSCADLEVPVIGVSLFYRNGYISQRLDDSGWQFEEREHIVPDTRFFMIPERVQVEIEGRTVNVAAWMYKLAGVNGKIVPIIFLDTDLPENALQDRGITHDLYQGDHRHRIKQEAVLGIAGVRMLEKIGARKIEKFHMNEGHSAFLTAELYRRIVSDSQAVERIRQHAVFTTHTPVAAGHDRFDVELVKEVLGKDFLPHDLVPHALDESGLFNMTRLGLYLSGHMNGVAKRHGEVSREMFPGYRIESITNGVHAREWTSEPMKELFKRYLPDWENDPYSLRYALSIPQEELWQAHIASKRALFDYVRAHAGVVMDEETFTIGFARRATGYKRAELLWSDVDRLKRIAQKYPKGIQIVFAGKAHPGDHDSKLMIQRIIQKMRDTGTNIRAVYLPNYNMQMAKLLVSGVDIWLNTPTRPQEASGTSGMKAALNGVPHFSVLDGWWLEGHIEHVTGWSIGPHPEERKESNDDGDREDMYTKLEYVVLARYYQERDAWVKMMRHAIAINGSFFNTHRMVEQYVLSTYFK